MSTNSRGVRAGQLPENPAPGVMLRCGSCGAEYVASRRDYFMLSDDDLLGPCGCGGALVLGREIRGRFVRQKTQKKDITDG